jgi:abequosyltransferase
LKKLLNSLESEFENNKLEIIINDNASSDGTEEMVREYIKKTDCIKYRKNRKNYGFDYNFNQAILESTGKFIWFLGSDDIVKIDAVKKIIDNLSENINIYILEGDMNIGNKTFLRNGLNAVNLQEYIKIENGIYEYIDDIKSDISYLFAFISSIVVKREDYVEIKIPEELKNSAYDHMYILLKLVSKSANIKYLKESYYEVGINENCWNNIRGKHFLLDIKSLHKFIENIYQDNKDEIIIRKSIGKLFQRNCSKISMIDNIFYAKENKEFEIFENAINYFYMNNLKYRFYKNILVNKMTIYILNLARKIKNRDK